MEIGELKTSFDDAERVGEKGAGESGDRRSYEILMRLHIFLSEPPESRKIDVAPHGSLNACSHQSLVEPSVAITFIDISVG